tara:strand:- start:1799 stop:2710 length:912 start_codon:yes stop_codon:yes gene_type:complete
MRVLAGIGIAVFVLAIPLVLITSAVRITINTPLLYSYGFAANEIPRATGIENKELISAARQIRHYFNDDNQFLNVRVSVAGIVRTLYNNREIRHMEDVKRLVRGVYGVQIIAILYLTGFGAISLAVAPRRYPRELFRLFRWGAVLTLSLVILAGIASLLNFNQVFYNFHIISFDNDLWQLDPSRDYLIAMFPQQFFFLATVAIALGIIVAATAVFAIASFFLAKGGRKDAKREKDSSPAERLSGGQLSGNGGATVEERAAKSGRSVGAEKSADWGLAVYFILEILMLVLGPVIISRWSQQKTT